MKIGILIFFGFFCLVWSAPEPKLLRDPVVYESAWAVHLQPWVDPSVLEKEGFEVLDHLSVLGAVYLVRHKETHERHLRSDAHKLVPSLGVTKTLKAHPDVIWTEQQFLKKKQKFSTIDDPLFSSQWHLINTGQFGGVPGVDVNIQGAWAKGFHGEGVRIAVVDDGYQYDHPDLTIGFKEDSSYSFADPIGPDPRPDLEADIHGTAVAGAALASNNSVCGVGTAYMAEGAGIRLLSAPMSDYTDAQALTYKFQLNDIYTNSWGIYDGVNFGGPGYIAQTALAAGVSQGRGGLGNIYLFAAGNGLRNGDDCNYNGYANALQTIAVAAVGNTGKQTYYSTPGACLLVTAPSIDMNGAAGIRTVDLLGANGYSSGDCTESFSGTSASTPMVAGIIALMLQANPSLTWRDIPMILAKTAVKNDPTDSDWKVNGAGYHINHKYGFGLVDATAAVNLALNYTKLAAQQVAFTGPIFVSQAIPDFPSQGLKKTFFMNSTIKIETVVITMAIDHPTSGDLHIVLTSPSGTESILSTPHLYWNDLSFGPTQNLTHVTVGSALYGPQLNATPITGQFLRAIPFDACGAISNCAEIAGRIAIANGTSVSDSYYQINGACNFTTQTKNLQACGAIAVFIASTDTIRPNSVPYLYGSDPTNIIEIPTFGLSYNTLPNLDDFEYGTLQINRHMVNNYQNGWKMSSTRHLGEQANGTWSITVSDRVQQHSGNFAAYSIIIYGHSVVYGGQLTSTSNLGFLTTGQNSNEGGGGGGSNTNDMLIGTVVGGVLGLLVVVIVVIVIVLRSFHSTRRLQTCICGEKHGPGGHPSHRSLDTDTELQAL